MTGLRPTTRIAAVGALALCSSLALASGAGATSKRDMALKADYDVRVGGLPIATATFDASLDGEDYKVHVTADGREWTSAILNFVVNVKSEGEIAGERPYPRYFITDTTAKQEWARKVELFYSTPGAAPTVEAVPPYKFKKKTAVPVPEFDRQNTQDPVSAVLVPVRTGENPCARTIPVFDGRRRYNFEMTPAYEEAYRLPGETRDSRGRVTESDEIAAHVCDVRFVPVSGYDNAHKLRIIKDDPRVKLWLAPLEEENLYFPVRLEIPTPFGAGIIEVTKFVESDLSETDTAALSETTSAVD